MCFCDNDGHDDDDDDADECDDIDGNDENEGGWNNNDFPHLSWARHLAYALISMSFLINAELANVCKALM